MRVEGEEDAANAELARALDETAQHVAVTEVHPVEAAHGDRRALDVGGEPGLDLRPWIRRH